MIYILRIIDYYKNQPIWLWVCIVIIGIAGFTIAKIINSQITKNNNGA